MVIEFYRRLRDWLAEGEVAIATVMQVSGSVPREVGAKMLVRANGEIAGTIGGGAGEAKVIQRGVHLLHMTQGQPADAKAPRKGWVEIDLTGNPLRDTEGVCGGRMWVWVECWSPEWGGAIARDILHHLESGSSVTLIIPLVDDAHPFLTEHPPSYGGLHPAIDGVEIDGAPLRYGECIAPPPTLLIIGAGHVGVALAKAAEFAGFRIVIQDDRPEVWRPGLFSEQTQILKGAIAPALDAFHWPDNLYIALVTRGIAFDLDALSLILTRTGEPPSHYASPRYIGMIGSVKRVRHVLQELEKRGAGGDRLSQIHAPIGINIGALTPEEIAISICAELIQVRRDKRQKGDNPV